MRICVFPLLLSHLALPSASDAQGGGTPFTVAETGRGYGRLQDAVDAIGSGNGTILVAAGRYRDCAVQADGAITYRAEEAGRSVFSGGICEDKAALVLRGRSAHVEGLVFDHMAVSDGNGAGIRLESGDLSIEDSLFRDSQQGLLTASFPQGKIAITRSTFSGLGRCDDGLDCAHSVYVGDYGSLSISHCRFEAGRGGHYVKSRAPRVTIVDNSFDDSQGHATNYMIDLPNGASGLIHGNEMVQGKDKENYSAFIALGAEGHENASSGLAIDGNGARFVPGVQRRSALLADWTGESLRIGVNDIAQGIAILDRR